MKRPNYLQLLGLMCALSVLLGGCLIKPARVPTRHFMLATVPAPEQAPATTQQVSVEVSFVKMPSYLLRDSMAVRKSPTEIEYLQGALWAERLDRCFQQTLANNLSSLLSSNRVDLPALDHERVVVRVSVDMKQFDVDTQGRGTFIAGWRITKKKKNRPLKSGQAHLAEVGASPRANPQVIATTLSALTAGFSRELARAISEAAQAKP